MTIKTPVKALRAWEPYVTPDADDLAEYMARPFTRIVDADEEAVVWAHDCFEFRSDQAERIVACLNACAGIPTDTLQAARAAYDATGEAIGILQRQRDEAIKGLQDVQQHLRITLKDGHRLSTTYVICERALARSKE